MEKRCILKNCASSCKNNPELSFYSFPLKNNVKYKQWLCSIPQSLIELPLQEYTYICSKHFSNELYQTTALLREDAVPLTFYTASNKDMAEDSLVEIHNFLKKKEYFIDIEKAKSGEEIHEMSEKTLVNVGTQACPKRTWATEREAKLRRKKFILQKRLQRREETIKLMRNIIELLRPQNIT